jgi:isoleucyl-tRNA synthetase
VFGFHVQYANIDGWEPTAANLARGATHPLDRWLLGELDATVAAVTAALDDFDALGGATQLATFIDDLSNWYVRRSRPRFWKNSDPAAHATLHECLVTTAKLLAPFCPFLAEELFTTLTAEPSVHLADWPEPQGRASTDVAESMAAARRLVVLGRSARTEAKVRTRQPLRRALLLHPGTVLDDGARAEIASELNVESLEDVDTLSGLIAWTVVPNYRALGPRLGPRVNDVKAALGEADGSALQRQLTEQGFIEVAGERITADEVEVRAQQHESFALAEDQGWAVALDLELDDDLRASGLAREVVRVINDLRKDQGFAIADRIHVTIGGAESVLAVIATHGDAIAAEVLALSITIGTGDTAVDIDGHAVTITLTLAPGH